MKIFVAGASGATGQRLMAELIQRNQQVVAVVRDLNRLPAALKNPKQVTLQQASLLDLSDQELQELVTGCQAIASCLGHNLTLMGLFGPPRRLVTDSIRRLSDAATAGQPQTPVRLVLMNTTGNHQPGDKALTPGEKIVLSILRRVLPPQADNEAAANYLRDNIGPGNRLIEWAVVRPDTLSDADTVTAYSCHPGPIRSAVFNPGKTSRINVAHFMADLITQNEIWAQWKGQMPVLYNDPADEG